MNSTSKKKRPSKKKCYSDQKYQTDPKQTKYIMPASNNMAKKILNTDWAGKRLLRPVGVPLGLVPELCWYMPSGTSMLIDPPVLQPRKNNTPKQKLLANNAKMKKFLIMKNEHLSKVPKMNPGPKNSQDTAVTFARKKYGKKEQNCKARPPYQKKTPACIGLRHRKPKCNFNALRPRKPGRILSKTKRGRREEKKKRQETESPTQQNTA